MQATKVLTDAQRALFFRYDAGAALNAEQRQEEHDGVSVTRFWFDSIHGARVPGVLWISAQAAGPRPLILLQHGAGGSKTADYIRLPALRWAREGYACAAIDAHVHGERQDGLARAEQIWRFPWGRRDHAVQMAVDLMRTLDYLGTRPEIDTSRAGFLGFSMGTIMGVPFVGLDRRVVSACFAIGGSLLGRDGDTMSESRRSDEAQVAEIIDPVHFAPLIAPRPVLMINGRLDQTVVPAAAERLYAALGEPKQIEWYEGGHTELRGPQFRQMIEFFNRTL